MISLTAYAKRGTVRWHKMLSQSNPASSIRMVAHSSSLFVRNCTIPIHVCPFHRSTSFKQYSGVGCTIVQPKSNDINLSISLSSLPCAPYLLGEFFGGVWVGEKRRRDRLVDVALHDACVDDRWRRWDGVGLRKKRGALLSGSDTVTGMRWWKGIQ